MFLELVVGGDGADVSIAVQLFYVIGNLRHCGPVVNRVGVSVTYRGKGNGAKLLVDFDDNQTVQRVRITITITAAQPVVKAKVGITERTSWSVVTHLLPG